LGKTVEAGFHELLFRPLTASSVFKDNSDRLFRFCSILSDETLMSQLRIAFAKCRNQRFVIGESRMQSRRIL
jgi:hypothetical protein